jgi:hypothetical protein
VLCSFKGAQSWWGAALACVRRSHADHVIGSYEDGPLVSDRSLHKFLEQSGPSINTNYGAHFHAFGAHI